MTSTPVIIIDDSEVDRYLLKRFLKLSPIATHVYEHADGLTALEALRDKTFSPPLPDGAPVILFVDINMPKMGGFELLHALESEQIFQRSTNDIHVYMISSTHLEEDFQRSFRFGFVREVIDKGYYEQTLIETILDSAQPKPIADTTEH
jgi:CheY-like chemotaxis protein